MLPIIEISARWGAVTEKGNNAVWMSGPNELVVNQIVIARYIYKYYRIQTN